MRALVRLFVSLGIALLVFIWFAGPTARAPEEAPLPAQAGRTVIVVTATPLPPVQVLLIIAPPGPTATLSPSPTPLVLVSSLPTPAPPVPDAINGLPVASLLRFPPEAQTRAQELFALGQALGRNPRAFSRLGDSVLENPHFLARFDDGPYNLGAFVGLQTVIDHYRGSFSRQGVAVRRGLHSWSVFDPFWALKPPCAPNEHLMACEIRLHNPSVILIKLGSNDVGLPERYESSLHQIAAFAAEQGVIPVFISKADRHEGSNQNNEILYRVALEVGAAVIDYDAVAGTMPVRGMDQDGVHLKSFFQHDYTLAEAFRRGYAVQNLLVLLMLEQALRVVGS